MRAETPEALFQAICDAIVHHSEVAAAAVLLSEPDQGLRIVAGAGEDPDRLRALTALADFGSCGDPGEAGGATLIPIACAGARVGVFAFQPRALERFADATRRLLDEVAAKASLAFDRFSRERERGRIAATIRRLEGRFALLHATNKAILKARDTGEMLQWVCDAAAGPGKLFAAWVALRDPVTRAFTHIVSAGGVPNLCQCALASAASALPAGHDAFESALRDGEPSYFFDLANDPRAASWRASLIAAGATAGAAQPLRKGGRVVGLCAFFLDADSGPLDDERIQLASQIAETVSFGLELFDRQRQKDAITRMFQALGATNEAIMRARTRAELFELVCAAAAKGGDFAGAFVGLARPESEYFDIVAAAGPDAAASEGARLAIRADAPEGRSLSGEAFRTARPCFSNDYLADFEDSAMLQAPCCDGSRSGAALPLLTQGRPVGVLIFKSRERGAFTPEVADLLRRLAENVSFALENFDREDERRLAEAQEERLARMFAALSATNEAIMRAATRAELFELVCEAAARGGRFIATAIALAEPGSDFLRIVATAGSNTEGAQSIRLAATAAHPEGRAIAGTAFRTRQPCISNDYLADPRTAAFRDQAEAAGVRACAAFPLLCHGDAVGVLAFLSSEHNAFAAELAELLQRLAENVAFALENFDRAVERSRAEQQQERLTRMYTALSATNEAIMRARTRDELFKWVCEAAVESGKFAVATVGMVEPGSDFLRCVARTGPAQFALQGVRTAISDAYPEGRGLTGAAFRTRQPCISNDYLADERGAAFHDASRAGGIRSLAALPLIAGGEAVGVLIFLAYEVGAFTPDLVELLQRLAENVSFALENFGRADERRLADERQERLTRMFAALSATNEAIMRAATREELFRLVSEAAVQGGGFASTIIALSQPGDDFMRVAAWAGPKGEMQSSVRLSVSEAYPEGRGVSGTAFRTLRPCIINDYLADERGAAFHERSRREGNLSAAALPLLCSGEAIGVLVFLASERDAFKPELVELLERMANNVSFALENFDRAEEKARADARIQYLATHDGLTDLPNRAMFNQLLHGAIEAAQRENRIVAVLFIDIDRFKVINDSLGHDAGDAFLVETAKRLRGCLGPEDIVARLGGDEFVLILTQTPDLQAIEATARRLLSVVGEPFHLCGLECRTSVSIGIAVFPDDGEDELTLTKNADIAMYRAKEEGKNGFRFFVKQNKTQSVERLVFEARLRQALERNEFSLHYQPKVLAATGRINGVEALLRWTLPDVGPLSPVQFIPLAEETGLIVPIGRWVLKTACAQSMAWRRQGLPPLSMAVNLSPRQFSDENLLQDIDDALAASGMPPGRLQLEITESMMMHNVSRAIELLEVIRRRGVRLAIDDFGTGYSSMSLMKKFPVDTIKIDRTFVQDLPHDAEDRAIAEAILGMGKALGLTTVAEGVETEAQADFLRDRGCDEMQGYLFGRPVPPGLIPEVLRISRRLSPTLQSLEPAAPSAFDDGEATDRASA